MIKKLYPEFSVAVWKLMGGRSLIFVVASGAHLVMNAVRDSCTIRLEVLRKLPNRFKARMNKCGLLWALAIMAFWLAFFWALAFTAFFTKNRHSLKYVHAIHSYLNIMAPNHNDQ